MTSGARLFVRQNLSTKTFHDLIRNMIASDEKWGTKQTNTHIHYIYLAVIVVPDARAVDPLPSLLKLLVRVQGDEHGADGGVHVAILLVPVA